MKILVLPGDGIGPEITKATLAVLDRANAKFKLGLEWQQRGHRSRHARRAQGSTLPDDVMEAARKAPGHHPRPGGPSPVSRRASKGGINPSGELRVKLDLFANIRPAKSRMGVGLTGKPVDLVIFRECTEGFYADRNMFMGRGEFMPTEDMAIAVRKVTARQCNRISRVAFDWARKRRKKVTAVHKANVLHISDGLFLREVRKVAQEYPDVELDEKIVDAMAALLVRDPSRFDCIVTGNMFGDILSDEASEISGSLGLAGSTMAGDDACCAQAQHGSAPGHRGTGQGESRLRSSSRRRCCSSGSPRGTSAPSSPGRRRRSRARSTRRCRAPDTRTPDLGGKLGTQAFAKHVAGLI